MKDTIDREWLTSRPIAHRGLHGGDIPENSIPAFEAALSAGVPIEIDVQLTKDKVPVIYHDDFLDRLTGVKKRVTRVKEADLGKLNLADTNLHIPRLDDFLKLVDGRVPILVEIKKNRGSRDIEHIVCKMLSEYSGRFAIQSFHPIAIRNIREINPAIFCGLLSSKFEDTKLFFLNKAAVCNARLFFIAKPDFISFEINSFPNRRIKGFREELNMPVLGWTVQSKADVNIARKFCDNFIFENIERNYDFVLP